MFRLKTLLATAIWLFIVQTLQAQQHYNSWFRATLGIPINSKIIVENELQHRRQNGSGNSMFFDKNLMSTYRNWIHYRQNSNIKFSLSPFAYFSNYKIIQKRTDETTAPNSEIRFSAAIDMQNQLLKNFFITNRTAVEYRIFNNSTADITRLRNRFGFRYDFDERNKISIFNEILLNATGASMGHFFDHHRIGINLAHKVSTNLKLDIGYIRIYRLPLTTNTKLKENNAILNISYQIAKANK